MGGTCNSNASRGFSTGGAIEKRAHTGKTQGANTKVSKCTGRYSPGEKGRVEAERPKGGRGGDKLVCCVGCWRAERLGEGKEFGGTRRDLRLAHI